MAKRSFRISPWNDKTDGYFVVKGNPPKTLFCSKDKKAVAEFVLKYRDGCFGDYRIEDVKGNPIDEKTLWEK